MPKGSRRGSPSALAPCNWRLRHRASLCYICGDSLAKGARPNVYGEEDVEEVLLSAEEVQRGVVSLGQRISADYAGKEVTLICILKGAVMFTADLMRQLTVPTRLDFIAISSYGAGTKSSGVVKILKDLDEPIEGKDVLVVEDIVDTGLTLKYLIESLQARKPASLRCCVFLDKPARREVEIEPDYVGYTIPDRFVVGYGLDYAGRYRNLPFVGVLRSEVYADE